MHLCVVWIAIYETLWDNTNLIACTAVPFASEVMLY